MLLNSNLALRQSIFLHIGCRTARHIVDKTDSRNEGTRNYYRFPLSWNFPLFHVPKKDGLYRPIIGFRRLNELTEDEQFFLLVLSDLLMDLGEENKFSLDLLGGYWQVPMKPGSRAFTAFSTPTGHYEWLRMPLGLKCSNYFSKDNYLAFM